MYAYTFTNIYYVCIYIYIIYIYILRIYQYVSNHTVSTAPVAAHALVAGGTARFP